VKRKPLAEFSITTEETEAALTPGRLLLVPLLHHYCGTGGAGAPPPNCRNLYALLAEAGALHGVQVEKISILALL
jgi:hypothetical protein